MTTLLVSTVGGHLAQLHELVPRFTGVDTEKRVWVTHRSAQSESLLTGEDVVWVPYIEERDVLGVAQAVWPAYKLIGARSVDSVISTGSAIAVAYLAAARLRRRRAVFVESTAFIRSRSRTGRIVQRYPGVLTYTQSPPMRTRNWEYRGSVLDNYRSEQIKSSEHGETQVPSRLVVTVGTSQSFGYRRLLERLVEIIPAGVDVLWQTGSTDVSGLDLEATPWVPFADLAAAVAEADVVIAHAGGGSALTALKAGRRPVLVPRSFDLGDFNDDHQHEIAELLKDRELAITRDVSALSWEDIIEASTWRVRRTDDLSPFHIGDTP